MVKKGEFFLWTFSGNNDRLVRLLVDQPQISVNLRGLDGYTALIRAAGERADYVHLLLSHPEIDPNLATYFGTTALTYAIRYNKEQCSLWTELQFGSHQ